MLTQKRTIISGKRRIVPIAVMLIYVSLFPLFYLFHSSSIPSAEAGWYNSDFDWPYRQKFQVTSSSALTDFQVVLDEKEAARWKMDEDSGNALDSSGHSLTATNSGTAVATGKYGNARSFNGSNAYLYTATGSPNFHLANGYTLSAWIKPSALTGGRTIVSQWGNAGAGNASWTLGLNGAYLYIGNHNGSSTSLFTDDTTALQTDTWYHVTGVYTGGTSGTNAYLYVNGNLVKSGTLSAIPQYSSNYYVGIGRAPVIGTDNYYAGLMDEVRVYGYGMSASDISYLYENNLSPRLRQIYTDSQESGADLRFTTSDGTTNIPYWIENYSASGQNAKIWLKVPVVANGTTDIYAYYGNAGASAVSSGTDTFEYFDDFESYASGSSIDGQGGWTIKNTGGTGGAKVQTIDSRKMMELTSTSAMTAVNNSNIGSKTVTASLGYAIETMDYTSDYNEYNGIGYGVTSDSQTSGECAYNGYHMGWYGWAGANSKLRRCVNGTSTDLISINDAGVSNAYYRNSFSWIGNTLTGFRNDVQKIQTTDINFSTFNTVYINLYTGSVWDHDWLAVRKIAATAPSMTLSGSSEIGDNVVPANPSTITAKSAADGVALNAANIYNYTSPYFEWPAVGAAGGASDTGAVVDSGVAGYYSYFGTSCGAGGADPASAKGNFLSEVGGTGVHYSTDTNISLATPLTASGNYCLRIRTADNAGNIQAVWEAFAYQFDNTVPSAPGYIAANPAGYSSIDSYTFSWPAVSDGASTPQAGLAGYQYKRGEGSGDSWSDTITAASVADIRKYQDGANSFVIRAVDNAGNYSTEVQTTYYYSNNPPAKPTDLAVSPEITDINNFSFSWTAPAHALGITDYAYSINQYPNANNLIWLGSGATALAAGPYATLQGANTLYLLAKDASGVYSFEQSSVASVQFICQTPVPPTPVSVSAHDSSYRASERWMITLNWLAGPGQNESTFDHYAVLRSLDGLAFSQVATTESTAYIDSDGLSSDTHYYYRIVAVDNANRQSVFSTIVNTTPSGRYSTPPTVLSLPVARDVKSNQAQISWVTNRPCLSFLSYGSSGGDLSETKGNMQATSDHNVTISGLKPHTKYYFRVQSIDEFRNYDQALAYSAVYEFSTSEAAQISNVNISNVTLTSADITWDTSVATNAVIYYGGSINYGLTYDRAGSSYVSRHSVSLTGLNHSSLYHFRIKGSDQDGMQVSSDDYTFETMKMPKISNIQYSTDYSAAAPQMVITWKTNVPTTSSISYYPSEGALSEASEAAKSSLVTDHSISLNELSDSTQYKFTISGRDQFGNFVESDENVLITDTDKRAAIVTDLVVENSSIGEGVESKAQLIIYWKTDEPTTSQVEYDEFLVSNSQYRKKSFKDATLKTEHLVNITGLDPLKLYHLRAISEDKAGNISYSEARVAISGEGAVSPFARIINMFNNIFGWVMKYL